MRKRWLSLWLSLVAGVIAGSGVPMVSGAAAPALELPQRISFQIATGSSTGTYFPVGALLSEILSHPPGVGRCEALYACGPSGLIVSSMASQGSVANVIS